MNTAILEIFELHEVLRDISRRENLTNDGGEIKSLTAQRKRVEEELDMAFASAVLHVVRGA